MKSPNIKTLFIGLVFTLFLLGGTPLKAGDAPTYRGKIILIVDQTMAANSTIGPKLDRLTQDLEGDGWHVLRHDVGREPDIPVEVKSQLTSPSSDPYQTLQNLQAAWAAANAPLVRQVKAIIKSDYDADPVNVKEVLLFGHVPIPYSGDSPPDGGHPNWNGASAADTFYGELSAGYGSAGWSDSSMDNSHALTDGSRDVFDSNGQLLFYWSGKDGYTQLVNVPGDGKFDQEVLPAPMVLAVGRVDLYNMPSFATDGFTYDEPSLLSMYLDKDHDFRTGNFIVQRRGLAGGDLASSSDADDWAPITTSGVAYPGAGFNWFPYVRQAGQDYLMGLGAGHGGTSGAQGVGGTSRHNADGGQYNDGVNVFYNDFVDTDSRVVFVSLFGSVFGEWDQPDDFLRAPLANPYDPVNGRNGYGLASIFGVASVSAETESALGETWGESLFIGYANSVYHDLMGDPSLRLHTVTPPTGLSASVASGMVTLNWTASTDSSVSGYNVYSAPTMNGPYTLITSPSITATTLQVTRPLSPAAPDNYYMVRAVKAETTPSGGYVNMSEGVVIPTVQGSAMAWLNIIHQPANETVLSDTSDGIANAAALTVDAVGIDTSGSENLTYQWYKDGVLVINGVDSSGSTISGATSSALLIANVGTADAGSYTVIITRPSDSVSVTSSAATLNVQTTPCMANADIFCLNPQVGPVDLDVLANDSGTSLSILSIDTTQLSPYVGTLTINSGGQSIHFVPNPNWNGGPASFQYTTRDACSSSSANVTLNLTPRTFQFQIAGSIGDSLQVSASIDFANWLMLPPETITANPFNFSDPSAYFYAHRFYSLLHGSGASDLIGFVNVTVPGRSTDGSGGYALVADQLNNPGGNTLAALLPGVPAGTTVTKYAPGTDAPSTATFNGTTWDNPGMTLSPGEGAFIRSPNTTPMALTFTGLVPSSPQSLTVVPGYNLLSVPFPLSASLDALGFPAVDNDFALPFDPSSQQYGTQDFYAGSLDDGLGFIDWYNGVTGNLEVPTPQVGESLFIFDMSSSSQTWTSMLSANPPTVSIASPSPGTPFATGANITLTATASSGTTVKFYENSSLIGQAAGSGTSYTYTWTSVPTGNYSITATAAGSSGAVTVSTPVSISVFPAVLSALNLIDNTYQFTINDTTDNQVTVQATEDFQSWTALGTFTMISGTYPFSDTSAGRFTRRFYRAVVGGAASPVKVGFVNVTVPGKNSDGSGGQALIANQLNTPYASGINPISVLLTTVPVGTTITKYNDPSGGSTMATFTTSGWDDGSMTLNPGEGASIQNPGTASMLITFVGSVPSSPQSISLPPDQSLVSSIYPVSVGLDVLGLPAADNEEVTRQDRTADSYAATLADDLGFIGWYNNVTGNPETPTPQVGEAFWVDNLTPVTQIWTQSLPPGVGADGFDSSGDFQLNINDSTDTQVTVQATQDFQSWTSLGTVTITSASSIFTDTSASSFAHRFYRVLGAGGAILPNQVGYVQVTVPGEQPNGSPGQAFIANQLNNLGGNTLGVLLPDAGGLTVAKFSNTGFIYDTFSSISGWSDPNMTLNPGDGAWIQNANPTSTNLIFMGYVPSSPQCVNLAPGWNMVSSMFPVSAGLDVLGFPAVENDEAFRFDTAGQQDGPTDYYDATGADAGFIGWYNGFTGNSEIPTPQVGESLFIYNMAPSVQTWTQSLP